MTSPFAHTLVDDELVFFMCAPCMRVLIGGGPDEPQPVGRPVYLTPCEECGTVQQVKEYDR